ncbi:MULTISPECIES: PRC-barrel domain-containing protein [Dehalobacter]|jgi:uncharacterized protein YrrD|uniref:PRC-barrel domain-containing protein n=2 Tax=Dehalobacter restrictus TaxID=55583 RepID=A0A857DHQ0_9FIRM|nr:MULTISPECIES: PRC-barrel domain-containing protein [Dehalobacter]AHF09717.1 hypothetical protein DEHRE_06245 [Dehalobacter restrictus DSM 9455]MCG1025374.1 PRC-barrel domain-containing protein [Dehalobacter sp.]OCZ52734.1 hypothetical protein A7D23_09415 [Dehalobacter sp. TeCB1]QHA00313.1 hypothetical protein GQ588_06520 [Dehalobacter restrictus]
MKSSAEIRGLKIISINEGKQISTVKDIIINSEDGSLAFFVIDQPSDYFGARLIAYADILGLGDYALIINDSTVVQDVAHNNLAVELLKKDVKVVSSQVLTTRGCLIGQVKEILFDETTGIIAACEVVDPQGKCSEFKCDHVITYGKEIILIDDNPPSSGKQAKELIKPERNKALEASEPSSGKESPALSEKELLKKKIEQFGKSESLLKTAENSGTIIYPEDFNVFEQRQLQFLLGKTLNNDIQLENGTVLKAGEQITGENLSGVKNRSTLMQLTAHVVK